MARLIPASLYYVQHPLIHDSWRAEDEEDDEEELKTIQRVKSGEDWTHWTHCDVWAKVVKDDAPSAENLGFSQDFESMVAKCLLKDEVLINPLHALAVPSLSASTFACTFLKRCACVDASTLRAPTSCRIRPRATTRRVDLGARNFTAIASFFCPVFLVARALETGGDS